ncbi:MAG: ribosome maturation factor RimM [Nevskia sp.]|nr:ribosome maturation factor RimM [Nevskia sp.]
MEGGAHRVTLGRIAGVYGIRGWVKVQSFTRPVGNLLDFPRWWIQARQPYEARLLEGRVHGGGIVAQLGDAAGAPIADRDAALALVGAEVQVERSAMPEPPAGSYYWSDLVGMEVASAGGAPLGRVTGLLENGAQDVLVVQEGDRERLIPFVHGAIIRSIDLPARRIVADWEPEY